MIERCCCGRFCFMLAGLVLLPTVTGRLGRAQDSAEKPRPEKANATVVSVNDATIRDGEIQRFAQQTLKRRLTASDSDRRLRRFLAEQLVTRELARQALAKSPHGVPWEAAVTECERRIRALKKDGVTLNAFLQNAGIDYDAWQREVHWRMAWKHYLEKFLTDDNLKRYFEQHRRHFDGTRLHVAHLLLHNGKQPPENAKPLLELAATLKKRIDQGELSFADAVQKYSKAPSANEGGDLGWIERQAPMPESFSRAAFETPVGQVSNPVLTRFGVHLIRVLEEKRGERTWKDATPELRKAVQDYLLNWLADQQRKSARIVWYDGNG